DAEREIKFGRDRLARRADLAVHGKPAGVANGTRGREFASQSLRELLDQFDIFLLLDAAAHRHNNFGLREVHRLLGFFENFLRYVTDHTVCDFDVPSFDRGGGGAGLGFVSAKSTVLERGKPRSVGGETDVGSQLAL